MTIVRTLTDDEIAELIGWARNEGWNPGFGDEAAFAVADPDGFIGAFAGDELAAGISVVRYGVDFGFLGLYICHPDFRGQGFGKAVWAAGMEHLSGRTVGLDGVPALQPYYQSMGFVKAHETLRYSGRPPPSREPGDFATTISIDAALSFDKDCFPAPRATFLRTWLQPPRIMRAAFNHGRLKGYGVVRACETGNKIGPLFAESTETAATILSSLADAVEGEMVIDVPMPKTGFRQMLEGFGMTPGFSTARMYRGPAPSVDLSKIFGLTTLELG